MKILCTWKLLRTTRQIRIRSPFVRHTPLAHRTHNFPPPVHLSENAKHREYFPGWVPPSPVSPIPALDHPWHRVWPCCILWYFVCSVFTVPSPLFYPLDFETNATAAAPIVYGIDVPSFSAGLPGKPPPWSPDIAYSFSLLLALE